MKNLAQKLLLFFIVVTILLFIIPTLAKATTENLLILEKASNEYLIYCEEVMNKEFEFAFSTNEKELNEDLIFYSSAKDTNATTQKNIAYIDAKIYSQYFADNTLSTYLWIKVGEDYIVNCKKIELNNAIDEEMLNLVNTSTKRIEVDTKGKDVTTETIEGVVTTVTKGKIDIKDDEASKYYYQIIGLPMNEDYTKLFDLADEIAKLDENTDIYNKLELSKEFYNLYTKLVPNVSEKEWVEVEEMQILQPQDSKNGEKYIVWINKDNKVTDVQFLTSYEDYEQEIVKEQVVIKETSKLPVTYDSITLIVIFALIIVAIVILIVLRRKYNKKEEK